MGPLSLELTLRFVTRRFVKIATISLRARFAQPIFDGEKMNSLQCLSRTSLQFVSSLGRMKLPPPIVGVFVGKSHLRCYDLDIPLKTP